MTGMGYSNNFSAMIFRTKHKVRFTDRWTVDGLIGELEKVPSGATVDEVLIDEVTGIISIEFHHERLESQPLRNPE